MSAVLALMRPDDTHFPLFVHVLGAMVLVGGLVTAAAFLAFAHGDVQSLRRGYWTLLAVALPGWFVMRIGAEWIFTREHWDDVPEDDRPGWLGIGFLFADLGGLILLVTLILGAIGIRRLRDGKGAGLLKATMLLSLLLLAAYVVAVWAMSGKPD
jgi:hypothetical protein